MDVYILRHATAVDVGEQGVTRDADRMLSATGRDRMEQAARGLRRLSCRPDRIVTSPLLRARETAGIAAAVLDLPRGCEIEVSDLLAPGAEMEALVEWLSGVACGAVMLVGHMPDLACLASVLMADTDHLEVRLKKAAVLHLSFPMGAIAGDGMLEWLLPPKVLRVLGN